MLHNGRVDSPLRSGSDLILAVRTAAIVRQACAHPCSSASNRRQRKPDVASIIELPRRKGPAAMRSLLFRVLETSMAVSPLFVLCVLLSLCLHPQRLGSGSTSPRYSKLTQGCNTLSDLCLGWDFSSDYQVVTPYLRHEWLGTSYSLFDRGFTFTKGRHDSLHTGLIITDGSAFFEL